MQAGPGWLQPANCLTDTAYPLVDPRRYPPRYEASPREPGLPRDLAALQQAGAGYFVWSSFKEALFEEVFRRIGAFNLQGPLAGVRLWF